MKKYFPFIIFLFALCISFYMITNKIFGHLLLLFGGTSMIIIYYFVKLIFNLLKSQFYIAINCLLSILILVGFLLKIDYRYYHPIILIFPLITALGINVYFVKKYNPISNEFLPIILIGLLTFFLSDVQILKFLNPDLTEYNSGTKLTWESFKGTPDTQSNLKNYVSYEIIYKVKEIKGTKKAGIVMFGINENFSWTRSVNDSASLEGLKYYLKIPEIYSLRLENLFESEMDKDKLLKKIKIIRTKYLKDENSFNYDILKNHYPERYELWKEKIDSELNSLKNGN